jgi:hypothetical protein
MEIKALLDTKDEVTLERGKVDNREAVILKAQLIPPGRFRMVEEVDKTETFE